MFMPPRYLIQGYSMATMIDSKKQQLNSQQIIQIALENTKSPYPPAAAYPAILTELSQPNSVVKIIGNTLFSVLKGPNNTAFFKAFNADIASNYVANSRAFIAEINKSDINHLVTQFTDPAILSIIKNAIRTGLPKATGYRIFKNDQDTYTVVFVLQKLGQ